MSIKDINRVSFEKIFWQKGFVDIGNDGHIGTNCRLVSCDKQPEGKSKNPDIFDSNHKF